LIEKQVSFRGDPEFPSQDLDEIFRKIAWEAVANHPLSGVKDENNDGVADALQ